MKSNTTLIIIASLIAAAGAYWVFSGTEDQPPLSASLPASEAQVQFSTLIGELQSISFNTSIFDDSRFNMLVDITTPVAPESPGRLDPLAPITGVTSEQ